MYLVFTRMAGDVVDDDDDGDAEVHFYSACFN